VSGPGRPKKQPSGAWRNPELLSRHVASIVKHRDPSDPESITEVSVRLVRLARRILPKSACTDACLAELRRLAIDAKPSEITRFLLGRRFGFTDRRLRRLPSERPELYDRILVARWG
jgi:hypothetical protein